MPLADQKPIADPVLARRGILPCQAIEGLIADGTLRLAEPAFEGQIQPASLDLRLGVTAFRVRASFLPGPDVAVDGKVKQLALHEIDLRDGAVLEVGCVYLVPLLESLTLPPALSAACRQTVSARILFPPGPGPARAWTCAALEPRDCAQIRTNPSVLAAEHVAAL